MLPNFKCKSFFLGGFPLLALAASCVTSFGARPQEQFIPATVASTPSASALPGASASSTPASSSSSRADISSYMLPTDSKCTTSCTLQQLGEYVRACDRGQSGGCFRAGDLYVSGCCLVRDLEKAIPFLDKACHSGAARACVVQGQCYREMGRSPQSVAELWEYACQQGDPAGCGTLGIAYMMGIGVRSDAKKALELFEDACRRGWVTACFNQGGALSILGDGEGARKAWRTACDRGSAAGCASLGLVLLSGEQGAPDPRAGLPLVTDACEKGEPRACNELGRQLVSGALLPTNTPRAMSLFSQSCEKGWASGCQSLAEGYEKGWDGRVDIPQALVLYEKACKMKNTTTCENADRLRHSTTSSGSTSPSSSK